MPTRPRWPRLAGARASGYRNLFYATLGTGIGTGIVFDGHIHHGRTGAAGEGGHMSIDYRGPRCNCGKLGCIEVLASGPAIARRARAKLAAEPARGSALVGLAKGAIETVTSEMVGQAYVAGDSMANEILLETIDLLSLWLGKHRGPARARRDHHRRRRGFNAQSVVCYHPPTPSKLLHQLTLPERFRCSRRATEPTPGWRGSSALLGSGELTSILRPGDGSGRYGLDSKPSIGLSLALAQQFFEQYLPVRGVKSPLQFFERQGNNIVVVKAHVFRVGGDFEPDFMQQFHIARAQPGFVRPERVFKATPVRG